MVQMNVLAAWFHRLLQRTANRCLFPISALQLLSGVPAAIYGIEAEARCPGLFDFKHRYRYDYAAAQRRH